MEVILFYITAPLSIALLLIVLDLFKDTKRGEGKIEAQKAQIEELQAKLSERTKKDKEALSSIREYHDQNIERQEKEIEETNRVHGDLLRDLDQLLREIDGRTLKTWTDIDRAALERALKRLPARRRE